MSFERKGGELLRTARTTAVEPEGPAFAGGLADPLEGGTGVAVVDPSSSRSDFNGSGFLSSTSAAPL